MATRIIPFTREWEPAVARFNQRMRAGGANTFDMTEQVATPDLTASVHTEQFLCVDETAGQADEVRGGIVVLTHPAWIGTADGAGRHEIVCNLQSPLSEGIVDPKYAMVAIQLIRFALKRSPRCYVVGMGNIENPLPRLLKASGWTVEPVPFFFRILNAGRCLRELQPLQRSAVMKTAARIGAITGTGALALAFAQRTAISTSGLEARSLSSANATDDATWRAIEQRSSFGVVRDSSTLDRYLKASVERFEVRRGSNVMGWFSILPAQMRDHGYFGNLKVGTLIDVAAAKPEDSAPIATVALKQIRAAGCDLAVSNQFHRELAAALKQCGFLSYKSNYLFATSKALAAEIQNDTAFVSRQDGDGLVNLG